MLMVTAELADRVDDPVHLPKRHAVHQFIEFVKVSPDGIVIQTIQFAVGFIQECQDGVTVPKVWWVGLDSGFHLLKIGIHGNIPPSKFVVYYLGFPENATVICSKNVA